MAEELTISFSVSGEKSGLKFGPRSATFKRTITERDKDEGTIDINTTAVDAQGTNIPIKASLASIGILVVKNLDAVNPVTIGTRVAGNFVGSFTIPAGEEWPLPISWAKTDIYGSATGAAVTIDYEALPRT